MLKNALIIISLLFVSQAAYSHSGGHGPVSEKHAVVIASNVTKQFTDYDPGLGFGKLDKSWKNLPTENIEIHKKGDGYYIVRITNMDKGKTLFMLLSNSGEVYDANFTGEFPGLQ